jgi:predicted CopG family antitoxin
MNLAEAKTIKVTGENHKRLKKVGQMHRTMNDVISRFLNFWEDKKRK